jgi:hypothetical protein
MPTSAVQLDERDALGGPADALDSIAARPNSQRPGERHNRNIDTAGWSAEAAEGTGGKRMTSASGGPAASSNGSLSFGRTLTFSATSLPIAAVVLAITVHMPAYFAASIGVPLVAVAAAFATCRTIDIPIEPALGLMMDRTRSRFGRYRLWTVIGAPLLMLGPLHAHQRPRRRGPRLPDRLADGHVSRDLDPAPVARRLGRDPGPNLQRPRPHLRDHGRRRRDRRAGRAGDPDRYGRPGGFPTPTACGR